MSINAYKPFALAGELASRLSQRNFTVVEVIDTDGYPIIKVGPDTAGSQSAVIKLSTVSTPITKDSLGNVANVCTPTLIQLVIEAGTAGLTVLTGQTLMLILGDTLQDGCRTELWLSANGVAPSVAALATPSNHNGTWDSIKYPLTSSM